MSHLGSSVPTSKRPRKVRFLFDYPLGDSVVFAGALRELTRCYPGQFDIEVECSSPEFWSGCSFARGIPRTKPSATEIETRSSLGSLASPTCPSHVESAGQLEELGYRYVSVDQRFFNGSNEPGLHLLQAFIRAINRELDVEATVRELRGEVFLTPDEFAAKGPVEQLLGRRVPYWVICNGGKFDRTVKWWPNESYQSVVDALRGRVLFVQVGRSFDYHPRLHGTLDYRGWSDLGVLRRLVYWADGVVCPITSLMHLAAAVPRPPGVEGHRPCVIVGGGIEPPHWTKYPGQDFLSTIGELPCTGQGCWKSRTVSLGDGDVRDDDSLRCLDVDRLAPRCMRLLEPSRVIGSIERVVVEGRSRTITPADWVAVEPDLGMQVGVALDDRSVTRVTARLAIEHQVKVARRVRYEGAGRGIATMARGVDFVASAWVMVRLLRRLGCSLPVELWVMEDRARLPLIEEAFESLGVEVHHLDLPVDPEAERSSLFAAKPEVLVRSRFREVLWLDADSFPVRDPGFLFEDAAYLGTGAVFWPEPEGYVSTRPEAWRMFGLERDLETSEVQGGELLVDKARVAAALHLTRWCNQQYPVTYRVLSGDKDIFRLAFRKMETPYAMPPGRSVLRDGCLFQVGFDGLPLFQHRVSTKLRVGERMRVVRGFENADVCQGFLDEFTARMAPRFMADH